MPRGGDSRGRAVQVVVRRAAGAQGRGEGAAAAGTRCSRIAAPASGRPQVSARPAAPDRAHHRLRARSAGRCRSTPFPRAWCRRCSRSRIAASTTTRASIRSAWSARSSPTCAATSAYLVGGSTHHAAAREQLLPDRGDGRGAADAPALDPAQAARAVHGARSSRRKATKDEILELYLNDVYLGQRGSFAIHGVAEASRLFFGKDVSNLSLAEAARSPASSSRRPRYSPFTSPSARRERRNVVLRAMADAGYITRRRRRRARRASRCRSSQRALDAEAPYFVDYVGQTLDEQFPGADRATDARSTSTRRSTSTCSALAQDAVRDGLARVDELLAAPQAPARRRRPRSSRSIPRTGEILALVGGRSYNQSQYNRAVAARRQPGSVVQAVRLPRRVRAGGRRGPHRPHAGHDRAGRADDVRASTSRSGRRATTRTSTTAPITLRRALAHVAQHRHDQGGRADRLRQRRRRSGERIGVGTPPQAVSVDRARRLRGDAVRDRRRPTRVPERRRDRGRCARLRAS